ncbi:hypothetical protein PoB_004656700 [Plakobranchus ocellatus]|uniref:Uncharacterized protein n=1 Tax=Plakobranchus ocellatus TaxID=259542 RepID=A0AAV4BL75_9GAST|nr:hypothetical protein PoB_004656700 [Plakobranchus ocellatus]
MTNYLIMLYAKNNQDFTPGSLMLGLGVRPTLLTLHYSSLQPPALGWEQTSDERREEEAEDNAECFFCHKFKKMKRRGLPFPYGFNAFSALFLDPHSYGV